MDLCSLKTECCDEDGKYAELMLENSLPLPKDLQKLTLSGIIMELPPWFKCFRCLFVLQLVNSILGSDPLCKLSQLPALVSLHLIYPYTGEKMGCRPGGFLYLRHLHIISSVELEEWAPIEEGAMPCLQFLSIVDCSKLRMLPVGFERIRTLKSLELIDMPQEFIRRLTTEDLHKIQHISKITNLQSKDFTSASSESFPMDVQRTSQSSGGMFHFPTSFFKDFPPFFVH